MMERTLQDLIRLNSLSAGNEAGEHEQYAARQSASDTIQAIVRQGMSCEEVEDAIAPVLGDWGKQARKSMRKEAYAIAGIGKPSSYHEDKGHLTKSSRGTYATVIGSRAYPLTRRECEVRGLVAGPGNN